jgi:hypothetical protein
VCPTAISARFAPRRRATRRSRAARYVFFACDAAYPAWTSACRSHRPSVGGSSLVAQYRNTSDKYLTVRVQLRNRTVGDYKEVKLSIAPNATTEHGWLQGWEYRSGERITIVNAEYETLELAVP